MTPLLVLAEIPTGLAVVGLLVTLLVGLVGVCGALMAQQYIVAANRVKEKFKALREAYASFVAGQHTHSSLWKAQHNNQKTPAMWLGKIAARLGELPPQLRTTAGPELMKRAEEGIQSSYAQALSLNERIAEAAGDIHKQYAFLFMLDHSPERREQVRTKYAECIAAEKRLHAAPAADEEAALAEYLKPFEGMEDWLAEVSAELSREEEEELAKTSWFGK